MKQLKTALYRAGAWLLQETPLYAHIRQLYRIAANAASADPLRNGEDRILALLAPYITTFVDAGANRGDFTKRLSTLNPAVRATCFEPAPALATHLRDRLPDATVVEAALGDRAATATLTLYGDASPLNSLHARTARTLSPTGTVSVPVLTLDAYALEHDIESIDFLKVDVEGAELAVLRGAHGLLSRRGIRFLQFEYGDTWIDARVFLKDLIDYAEEVGGYSLYRIKAHSLEPIAAYSPALESFMYQNYLLVRTADDPFARTKRQAATRA